MAFTQNSIVSWADIRNLYDKVNAERHRLLLEAVADRYLSPVQNSIVENDTPIELKELAAEIISENTFARTDLASTLSSINSLGVPAVGSLLTADGASNLSGYLNTITAYNPRLRTGTLFTSFNATFHTAFTTGYTGGFTAGSGTFNSAFGTGCSARFFSSFGGCSARFFSSFGGCSSRFFSSHNATVCGGFTESGSCFCWRSFTYGGSNNTRTNRSFHGTFRTSFSSFHGTFSTSFSSFNGTFNTRFGSGFSGFSSRGGTVHNAFGAQVVTSYSSYCSTFNSSFCPSEFCTSFNAASFFNRL